jgi:hypothetical protein
VVQIAQKFEHFLEVYRRPDGSRWGGQDLHQATSDVVTRSYVSNLRKVRIENPGFEKLRAITEAMDFAPEVEFEESVGKADLRYAIQVGQRTSSSGSGTTTQTRCSSVSP